MSTCSIGLAFALVIVATGPLIGSEVSLFAQPVCSPLASDEVASMSDALKKATITNLHLKAYKTGDLSEKITCYDQILNVDPTDAIAKSELEKAQQQLKDQIDVAQKEQSKETLLQRANNALAAGDEAAPAVVLNELNEALKTTPADRDLSDARQRIQSSIDRRKVLQQVSDATRMGHDAYFAESSAQLAPALRAIDDALKVDPTNAALGNWKQKIESRLSTERFVWWLKVAALVAAIAGVIAVVLYLLRKRRGLLEFVDGDRIGEVFQLDKPAIRIGALSNGNDLVVTDSKGKISRYHCEIVREGRRYFIKDASTNGTWLNEECLESGKLKLLRKGDRLSLAHEATLIFRLE
jgi:tetratricopeptide (TPR) repeat protein